ncbi:hypothetical protein, partial [Undibacterium crateris]|uniref:hypothetical protein n=1 Tax=Undibacterium crateris TaxID=2528175 RepID=UPI00192EBCF4
NNPYKFVDPDGREPQIVVIEGVKRKPVEPIEPFYSPVQSSKGDPIARAIVKLFPKNTNTAPATPPPEEGDQKEDQYKKPNEKLEKGDKVDILKFDRRVKVDGEVRFQDQKSGYQITPDRAGGNSHGGSAFKLVDRAGNRVATLNSDGVVLRK